ncbi:hypothetical protein LMG31886_21900 [Xanthomonas hydrangeae]|nr:hypothetical protein LMG31886_21900 [Xanthomonas hydrangeae]CAD7735073.1 hypothetical protein LMG31886_21900 [Xanthomonas hydrangeae]CAD7744723.1 hypothetical protein LMG31885_38330 [Xanthomonas hydrangeae]CAD7744726.1 hypothetical protein LMG31885_38330 [Xanthomonas hydrangeae]
MGQPHLDQWIADRLFAWEGHAWTLQHDTLLQGMFHVQARHLSILTWYAMTLVCVVAWVP